MAIVVETRDVSHPPGRHYTDTLKEDRELTLPHGLQELEDATAY